LGLIAGGGVIYGRIKNNELTKIKNDLLKNQDNYENIYSELKKELKVFQVNQLIFKLESINHSLRYTNDIDLLNNGELVGDFNAFLLFTVDDLNIHSLKYVYSDDKILHEFVCVIHDFIQSCTIYAVQKKYIQNVSILTSDNAMFYKIMSHIKTNIGEEDFKNLKTKFSSLPTLPSINWGDL